MAMQPLAQDFKEFLKLLNSKEVEYLLVGGYAVGHYGYPRTTLDIDFWVAPTPENAAKMVQVLREFGYGSTGVSEELFLREHQNVRMGLPPVRIEILTSISGVDFNECYAVDGEPASIISLKHLKINKAASGRHKDLNDLENLS